MFGRRIWQVRNRLITPTGARSLFLETSKTSHAGFRIEESDSGKRKMDRLCLEDEDFLDELPRTTGLEILQRGLEESSFGRYGGCCQHVTQTVDWLKAEVDKSHGRRDDEPSSIDTIFERRYEMEGLSSRAADSILFDEDDLEDQLFDRKRTRFLRFSRSPSVSNRADGKVKRFLENGLMKTLFRMHKKEVEAVEVEVEVADTDADAEVKRDHRSNKRIGKRGRLRRTTLRQHHRNKE